jgi:hypothetical protein
VKTVRHWKRSGFSCDHHGFDMEDALTLALECANLSKAGVSLMKVLLEDRGKADFIVPGQGTFVFKVVGWR